MIMPFTGITLVYFNFQDILSTLFFILFSIYIQKQILVKVLSITKLDDYLTIISHITTIG